MILYVEAGEEDTPFLEALGVVLDEQPVTCTYGVVAYVDPEIMESGQRAVKHSLNGLRMGVSGCMRRSVGCQKEQIPGLVQGRRPATVHGE